MKKRFLPFLCLALFAASMSCEKDQANIQRTAVTSNRKSLQSLPPHTTYVINKGGHYSSPNPFKLISKNELVFYAGFDSSCIYTTQDPLNQQDINKLYGFSDCNSQHETNSARLGWYWYQNALHISAFVHNNGNMIYQDITTAPVGKIIKCRITCLASVYQFEVNGVTVELPRNCSGNYTRYKLYPYFGGDETAPHTIRVYIADK